MFLCSVYFSRAGQNSPAAFPRTPPHFFTALKSVFFFKIALLFSRKLSNIPCLVYLFTLCAIASQRVLRMISKNMIKVAPFINVLSLRVPTGRSIPPPTTNSNLIFIFETILSAAPTEAPSHAPMTAFWRFG